MIPSKTTVPMTAVLKPVEVDLRVSPTSSSFLNASPVNENPVTIMMKGNTTVENIKAAVLREPSSHTTPMTFFSQASSSPMVDHHKFEDPPYYGYVLIPVILMLVLAVISGIVFYFMQKRKQLDSLRHHLIPVYKFAPGEEEEWGVLLDADNDPKTSNFHRP